MGNLSNITLSKLPKCEVKTNELGRKVVVLDMQDNFITEHQTYGIQLPVWINEKTITIRPPKDVNIENLKTHEYNGKKSLPPILFINNNTQKQNNDNTENELPY